VSDTRKSEPGRRYGTVLFDLDHTIFDFDSSELAAFAAAMSLLGLAEATPHFATYQTLNHAMWAAAERGEMRSTDIRNLRFQRLVEQLDVPADEVLIGNVSDTFVSGLGTHGDLFPHARAVLETLAGCVRLGLISNGLGEVVHARLDRLGIRGLFDTVVVSSEAGVSKPNPRIFEIALTQLGDPPRESVLMVGDSLSSDVAGGQAAGIDTCWYNPASRPLGEAPPPTHQVATLSEIVGVVGCR